MALCKCGCGGHTKSKYVRGHNPPLLGWHHTVEARQRMREAKLGRPSPRAGKHLSEETRQKLREANIGKHPSEETLCKMRAVQKYAPHTTEEGRKKHGAAIRRAWAAKSDEERRMWAKNISEGKKECFKDPEFCKKMGIAWGMKPNKPESLLAKLLEDLYPSEWKYTGDFSFAINGKNPDFVNRERDKVIEFFGDYFHAGQDPADRAAVFAPFGYQTLIIWESEMKNMEGVVSRIHAFMEA